MWSRNLANEGALAHWGMSRQKNVVIREIVFKINLLISSKQSGAHEADAEIKITFLSSKIVYF